MIIINYIELQVVCGSAQGEITYKPLMVKLDSIEAIKETAILVSGNWIPVREGRQGVVAKIQAAIREMNAPQSNASKEPSAAEIEATSVPF